MVLGIDASTPGSGGGKRHLFELLKVFKSDEHHFEHIKVWGVESLLNELPDNDKIIKITHPLLNGNFFQRILWQVFYRDREIINNCDVLFCPFGTYIGSFRPFVSMSRNMLVFDQIERKRFGVSWIRFKLKMLFYVQVRSFTLASGIIFLSNYAKESVSKVVNLSLKKHKIIHHGVSQVFNNTHVEQKPVNFYTNSNPFKLLYVSSVLIYKHIPNVVKAVSNLRSKGYPVVLKIVGSADQKSEGIKLAKIIYETNKTEKIISWEKKVGLTEVVNFYKTSDAFVFASTCENMPNIVIEAMASGLPIACSNHEPMPEFLKDAGVYFNSTDIRDIERAIKDLVDSNELRTKYANLAYEYSKNFSWHNCAQLTFDFLKEVAQNN